MSKDVEIFCIGLHHELWMALELTMVFLTTLCFIQISTYINNIYIYIYIYIHLTITHMVHLRTKSMSTCKVRWSNTTRGLERTKAYNFSHLKCSVVWLMLTYRTNEERSSKTKAITTLNFHILRVATYVSCSSIMRKYNSYMNIIDNVNFKNTFKTTSLENTAMVLRV